MTFPGVAEGQTVVRLPRYYGQDAYDRLETGRVFWLRSNNKHVWLSLDREALEDMLSDARYYTDANGPDLAPRGLKQSARAAIPRLEEAIAFAAREG